MARAERPRSNAAVARAGSAWTLATPAGVAGAVAIVEVHGDVDGALDLLDLPPLVVGQIVLRDVLGVDHALVARVSQTHVQLMPHGGTAVLREVLGALIAHGIPQADSLPPLQQSPEAIDEVEARMLAALSAAPSPLAVDLLLDQPRRWRAHSTSASGEQVPPQHAAMLRRLLVPPLVVVVGPANVGKSTMLNRLAGRRVAIVADEPGTTRDHVGAMLDLGGLVVRYVDTPGLRPTLDPIEQEAAKRALELAAVADLLILVGDAGSGFPRPPIAQTSRSGLFTQVVLTVGLRSDLGATPGADLSVSALTGDGLEELVTRIRTTLVPEAALQDPRPWQFWQE